MRFLFVNRFYGEPDVPTGRMLEDVVSQLKDAGHEVTVITGSADYISGRETQGPKTDKVRIQRLPMTGGGRASSWLIFWLQALFTVAWSRWDRCVLMTDPPFLTMSAPIAKLFNAQRRIDWWTMDLYPEALVAGGIFDQTKLLYRALWTIHAASLRAIDGVIALGPRQMERLQDYPAIQGIEICSIIVPPWDDRPLPAVAQQNNRVLSRMDWQDRKIAIYAGNLGFGHTFIAIVEAARKLHEDGDDSWVFAFFCRGANRDALTTAAADLPNVVVSDYVPQDETPDLLQAATVHLITMADGWEGIVVPSKLYGVLHTPAPVLFIGPQDADTAIEIRKQKLGDSLPNGTAAEAVVDTLEALAARRRPPLENSDRGTTKIVGFLTRNSSS